MGVSQLILLSVNTKSFKGSDGAPSFGCQIGDRGNSEAGSSIFSDDAPPSLTDVVRRDASESSFNQNLHEVKFEEASSSTLNSGEISPNDAWYRYRILLWMKGDWPFGSETLDDQDADLQYSSSTTTKQFSFSFGNWQKADSLGSGSFGTIYEGINDQGYFFAVKEISLLDQDSQGKESIAQLEQEISLLSRFHHDNIVRYLGTDKGDGKLYIFLELVTKGSLARLYQKYQLRESQVSLYTRQILSGLNYLHERSVVHRDIKCANILVDVSGSVKLADFGLAEATASYDIRSCKGSPYWMAPEVVNNRGSNGYGVAADIWSLGCTVLEMLTSKVPYSHLEGMQALFKIGRGELPPIPSTLSAEAHDFIIKCLQPNPEDRPTAAQLLDHPFLAPPPYGHMPLLL